MIPLITTIVSAFVNSKVGKKKIGGFSQSIGEATTTKTGVAVLTIIGFSIDYILDNPESSAPGWVMLGLCLLAVTLRDTGHKILVALKELKGQDTNG